MGHSRGRGGRAQRTSVEGGSDHRALVTLGFMCKHGADGRRLSVRGVVGSEFGESVGGRGGGPWRFWGSREVSGCCCLARVGEGASWYWGMCWAERRTRAPGWRPRSMELGERMVASASRQGATLFVQLEEAAPWRTRCVGAEAPPCSSAVPETAGAGSLQRGPAGSDCTGGPACGGFKERGPGGECPLGEKESKCLGLRGGIVAGSWRQCGTWICRFSQGWGVFGREQWKSPTARGRPGASS